MPEKSVIVLNMSNQHKGRNRVTHPPHAWEQVERSLDDQFSYHYHICKVCHEIHYPGPQLQKIQDYSKENLFLFVEDWVILLLYSGHEYISGITHYQKMLFLIFKEFIPKHSIPSENPGFYGYKYGPYSARIDEAIDHMMKYEYIRAIGRKSTKKERFYIIEKGKQKGEALLNRLSKEQQKELTSFRVYWDQKTTKSLLKYIYSNPEYSEYLDKSLILNDLFPGRTLYRRRG